MVNVVADVSPLTCLNLGSRMGRYLPNIRLKNGDAQADSVVPMQEAVGEPSVSEIGGPNVTSFSRGLQLEYL